MWRIKQDAMANKVTTFFGKNSKNVYRKILAYYCCLGLTLWVFIKRNFFPQTQIHIIYDNRYRLKCFADTELRTGCERSARRLVISTFVRDSWKTCDIPSYSTGSLTTRTFGFFNRVNSVIWFIFTLLVIYNLKTPKGVPPHFVGVTWSLFGFIRCFGRLKCPALTLSWRISHRLCC